MRNIWLYAFFCLPILFFVLPHDAAGSSAYDDWKRGNYQSAIKKFEPKAKDGDVFSQAMLGRMYKKGQGVEKNYKQAVKWFANPAGKGDVVSAFYLGTIYQEGGYGVQRNYARAIEYFLKVAAKRHISGQKPLKIYALQRLGIYYSTGTGVQQDHKQAVKWFTYAAQQGDAKSQARLGALYMQGLGVSRNPAAAYKWMEMSADGLNENIGKTIPDTLKKLDVEGFLKARARWRDKFPAHMKPFGIVLGKRFPAELDYDLTATFNKSAHPLFNTYASVKPPQKFPGETEDAEATYTISTTKISDRVYKISAKLRFDSQTQCRETLSAYYQNGPGSVDGPVIIADWNSPPDYRSQFYQSRLFVADFDVGFPPKSPDYPLRLHDADNLSGVRLVLSCQDTEGKIIFVHYPSVEKRIAETIEVTDWWSSFYDSPEDASNRPGYMNPFGIKLGQPLPTAQRQSDGGDDVRFNIFAVNPPKSHEVFTGYSVQTSRMSNSVIRVQASGRFNSKDHCFRVMMGSADGFLKKYGEDGGAKNTWHQVGPSGSQWFTSSFQLSPDGILVDRDKAPPIQTLKDSQYVPNMEAKYRVNVELSCSYTDASYWSGMAEYTHPLSEVIADEEKNALNLHDF